MSEKHTPGPWKIWSHPKGFRVGESENKPVAEIFPTLFVEKEEANARRIAACWNACQGISTEELVDIANMGGMLGLREDIALARIAGQRNELLEALKGLMALSDHRVDLRDAAKDARAAIAKATGEQA